MLRKHFNPMIIMFIYWKMILMLVTTLILSLSVKPGQVLNHKSGNGFFFKYWCHEKNASIKIFASACLVFAISTLIMPTWLITSIHVREESNQ